MTQRTADFMHSERTLDIPFDNNKLKLKTYDVSFKKESGEKGHWIKIGIAFANESGSISLSIDSIPLNWNGKLTLFERKEK